MSAQTGDSKELKITYYLKDPLRCPACDATFYKEELLSGGGRMIAGPLTDELHRVYEPSAKYGSVYPLIYSMIVCPSCWFASGDGDFQGVTEETVDRIQGDREARIEEVLRIFPHLDFVSPRSLSEGAASYYLALRCYDFFPKEQSPTLKQGIASLRAAWLFDDLHRTDPLGNYDWLSTLFHRKAHYLYKTAVAKEQSGQEPLSGIKSFGPDIDKNYAYEGALYLSALLEMKFGKKDDPEKRKEALGESKRTIAKIFGLGKSSKAKPGPLLEKARALYDQLNQEIDESDD